jgi:hypothetical protein
MTGQVAASSAYASSVSVTVTDWSMSVASAPMPALVGSWSVMVFLP